MYVKEKIRHTLYGSGILLASEENQTKKQEKIMSQNTVNVLSVTLSVGSDLLTVRESASVLLIVSRDYGVICETRKGKNPSANLATYIATLHPDMQLDTLEAIRAAGRLVLPAFVSDKETLKLYPDTVVRI